METATSVIIACVALTAAALMISLPVAMYLDLRRERTTREAGAHNARIRYINGAAAERLAAAGTVAHEAVRTAAEPVAGLGEHIGSVRLYQCPDGDSLVRTELWLSSMPHRYANVSWSGHATRAEGLTAYYQALQSWQGRDSVNALADGRSFHTQAASAASIVSDLDVTAVVTALDADLDHARLNLTAGSLPARLLNAANRAGYDTAEVRALDLTDASLLPSLEVAAALNV